MGLGIGMACVSFSVGAYYTMIAGWALFYLFNSFANPLPWSKCPTTVQQDVHVGVGNVWETIYDNITYPVPECALAGSANYFWYRTTLDISDDISSGTCGSDSEFEVERYQHFVLGGFVLGVYL